MFLNFQIYIFWNDLEKINITMNILISFLYEIDINYNWYVFSIEEYEIKYIEDSKIIGNPTSSVIGINISYTENYSKKLIIDSSIICYDIEGKEFHFFCRKNNEDKDVFD